MLVGIARGLNVLTRLCSMRESNFTKECVLRLTENQLGYLHYRASYNYSDTQSLRQRVFDALDIMDVEVLN